VQQIQAFKREQGLEPGADAQSPVTAADYDDEIDLRAEDDALIAAELDAAAAAEAEAAAKAAEEAEAKAAQSADEEEKPKRRRATRRTTRSTAGTSGARRRGRGRGKAAGPLEATFDHGEEGYGLWLDPAVEDDPVYAEYWAGHRPVEVTIEEDQIVIRRAGEEDGEE